MEATCLFSLADISLADTEPPLTLGMTESELRVMVEEPLQVDLPCHTVAVERGVKETMAGVLRTADPVLQDGATFMISKSRKKNPIREGFIQKCKQNSVNGLKVVGLLSESVVGMIYAILNGYLKGVCENHIKWHIFKLWVSQDKIIK